ncbi:MAG: DUF2934 domain-containing protein [Nitrospira sp.]|nr:DUF2934 domain-containing protein [Nitrospira sp.]
MPRVSANDMNRKPKISGNREPRATSRVEESAFVETPSIPHSLLEQEQVPQIHRSEAQVLESQDDLHQRIAERAFLLYEANGFKNGYDVEHWLEAERQIHATRA